MPRKSKKLKSINKSSLNALENALNAFDAANKAYFEEAKKFEAMGKWYEKQAKDLHSMIDNIYELLWVNSKELFENCDIKAKKKPAKAKAKAE